MKFNASTLAALVFIFSTNVHASSWTCQEATYPVPPEMSPDHIYSLSLTSNCHIVGVTANDYDRLRQFLTPQPSSSLKILSGPTTETFEGQPSEQFQVSETTSQNGGDTLRIESAYHLTTGNGADFEFANNSEKISATGNSKYLRQIDKVLTVKRSQADAFVVFTYTVHIAKPGFSPVGIFEKEVKKNVGQDYMGLRNELLTLVTRAL